MTHFRGSQFETNRCPHWHIKQTNSPSIAMEVFSHSADGNLGPGVLDLSCALVDAVNCIRSGRLWAEAQKANDKQS
jgi:hypothetical protein